jgi:hypothetical protein
MKVYINTQHYIPMFYKMLENIAFESVKFFGCTWAINMTYHYKKPVFFVMSPKIVDVLLDINILEKEM